MAQGSSLPPARDNRGTYALIALLLLIAAGALWYFFARPAPEVTEVEAIPPPPTREQFEPQIEIPEDAAVPEPAPEPIAEPERPRPRRRRAECVGTLEASVIREVINGPARRQVRACYERRLRENNLLQGSMNLLLTIDESGSVSAVEASGSLQDQAVFNCVKRVARTWKFPPPQGGCVRTSVPFTMTPKP